ncbi:MAG: PEP-CTERM sorting domain-containing protein [Rhodobacteraceae bacterium]|nr:PEP-CTERM sorting domain-containing protein [Paracoccaceae bacterium]
MIEWQDLQWHVCCLKKPFLLESDMSTHGKFAARTLLFATGLLLAAPAAATPIDYALGLNTLPSAQGWTNVGSNNIAEGIFSANGSLAWNTMPYEVNVNFQNYSYYIRTPAAGTYDSSPWTLFWDVKVQESEPATPSYYWAGAYTAVGLDGYNLGIGLGTNNISIFKDYYAWSYSYNFALPHAITDWTRIELATDASHHFTIALDGVLLDLQQSTLLATPSANAIHKFAGAPSFVPAWDTLLGGIGSGQQYSTGDLFAIGDGSIGSNARTETGCWYLTQSASANAGGVCANRSTSGNSVVEPGVLALFGLGFLGLVFSRRRA